MKAEREPGGAAPRLAEHAGRLGAALGLDIALGELKRRAAGLLPRLRGVFGPRIASINLDEMTVEA